MSTNPKPAYRRVLLKLSGEALQGSEGFGIDPAVLERMRLLHPKTTASPFFPSAIL